MRFLLTACGFAILLALTSPLFGADDKPPVQWTAKDTTGKDIAVPVAGKPTLAAFLRVNQPQNADAVAQLNHLSRQTSPQFVIILSGDNAPDAVAKFIADNKVAWPVIHPGYALSGKMSVHVWPTTAVIASDGKLITHLAGLPPTYEHDLHAYLDYAEQKTDKSALDQRLTTHDVVAPTTKQAATRYIIIADALIERDQLDEARAEIERGLKLSPNETSLRVAFVRVLIRQKQYTESLAAADQLKDAAPPWQVNLLRAEALIALERWPDAKIAVADAVKLNPHPAHAHYLAGQVYANENDWQKAADSFRRAYETAQASKHE